MLHDPRVPLISSALVAVLVALALAMACGCRDGEHGGGQVELVVFAASSLTEAFEDLERGFERAHPEVDVQPIFAGSQVLRLQLEQGARADVFASANERHMRALVAAELVSRSRIFALNEPVVIVPPDNPAAIERFDQLGQASRIVIGTDHVPVGVYTRQMLERARARLGDEFVAAVEDHVVSEESNVRLVRAKVELGEADAAVVYRTDAAASDRVRVVPIPDDLNVRARYPIAVLARSRRTAEANAFVAYVLSPAGRQILERHGFVTEME